MYNIYKDILNSGIVRLYIVTFILDGFTHHPITHPISFYWLVDRYPVHYGLCVLAVSTFAMAFTSIL